MEKSATETTVLMTSEQLAGLLGITHKTIRRWRQTGDGPRHIKLGTGPKARVRYRTSDVNKWLDSQARLSTSDQGNAA